MNTGWIKLHRSIIEWEWWGDANTTRLFIYMLLSANHEDAKWQGIEIKRGQLLTGRKKLADMTGISEQSIRTSLTRLKSTNEITIKSTKQYSIITINNYNAHQQVTSELTNSQPTTNQQLTTNKKEENDKKDKKGVPHKKVTPEYLEELKATHPTVNVLREWEKAQDWLTSTGRSYKDDRAFFRNWLKRSEDDNHQKRGGVVDATGL